MEKNKECGVHSATTSVNAMDDLRKNWQGWIKNHIDYQKCNPFSNDARVIAVKKGDPAYGRPPEGSKTEQRGKAARVHVEKELEELCWIMRNNGEKGEDGSIRMTFKQLFERKNTDKLEKEFKIMPEIDQEKEQKMFSPKKRSLGLSSPI
ncbi:actin-binding Rho-activating protein-like isoform X2 [Macrotis lagotis]|uniref:actin-binding Rho-activating protein-like isoform X2 n=1 Tax=Macrotis lagotis TaxID=92651 RepID=UPI003D68D5A9